MDTDLPNSDQSPANDRGDTSMTDQTELTEISSLGVTLHPPDGPGTEQESAEKFVKDEGNHTGYKSPDGSDTEPESAEKFVKDEVNHTGYNSTAV